MLSDNTMDSDKSSGVTISHHMSALHFPSDDAQGVRTDLNLDLGMSWGAGVIVLL